MGIAAKPFADKYVPSSPSLLVGQQEGIAQLSSFVSRFREQKKKAILLYGPSGTGKTSAAHAIASQAQLEIVEVNASDTRNAAGVTQIIGGAVRQQSLFSRGKLILVDEIDGLAGNQDRGGMQALLKLLEGSRYPIVLTATNPYDEKLNSVRSKCILVKFSELNPDDLARLLRTVCDKEHIHVDDDALRLIARRSGGDARAALTNLEVLSILHAKITTEEVGELSDRDRTETILAAISKIMKTTDLGIALSSFSTVDEDVDERILWLDENIPSEYKKKEDLARAYDALSKADIFNRRIRRWQHWRFLVYVDALLSGGVAAAKDSKYPGFTEYKRSGRILKLWWAKQKSMKKKAIASKIAQKIHASQKQTVRNFPYLLATFHHDKLFRQQFIAEFEIDDEELEWLEKNTSSIRA